MGETTMKQTLRYEQSPFEIDYSLPGLLRMNLNENLVLPASFVRKTLRECERRIDSRFYPSDIDDGEMKNLKALVAGYCGARENMVELGCGSDQLIDLLCRMKLGRSTDELVTVRPTFSMYALRAKRCGARIVQVPLGFSLVADNPFPLKTGELASACRSENGKILALASPNNPTAIQYELEQIREILDSVPSRVFLLLDEAYVEFGRYNAASLLRRYPNLILLRTFSKAFGLASHRIGYIVSSNRDLLDEFEDGFQYPFPLTTLSAMLAGELLRAKKAILRYAEETKKLRGELIESLRLLDCQGFRVVPKSDANFVLVESPHAEKLAKSLLRDYKIAVKYMPRMIENKSFIRITVGTRTMNTALLKALREILGRL